MDPGPKHQGTQLSVLSRPHEGKKVMFPLYKAPHAHRRCCFAR